MKTMECGACGKSFSLDEDAADVVDVFSSVGSPMCDSCFDDWRAKADTSGMPEPVVEKREGRYTFTDDMGEISGFGGGYEQTCRNMLAAGLEWWDANPKADPRFQGYEGVYGILGEDNDDAKALTKAVIDASGGDATGAMHQATISHVFFVRKNGWEKYCEEMRSREDPS